MLHSKTLTSGFWRATIIRAGPRRRYPVFKATIKYGKTQEDTLAITWCFRQARCVTWTCVHNSVSCKTSWAWIFFPFFDSCNIIPCYWIQYISRFACEPEMYFRSGLCKRLDSHCIFTQSSLTCSSPNVKEQTHQPIVSLKVLYFSLSCSYFIAVSRSAGIFKDFSSSATRFLACPVGTVQAYLYSS